LLIPTSHLSEDLGELQNFSFVFVRAATRLALPNPPNMSDSPTAGLVTSQSKSTYLLGPLLTPTSHLSAVVERLQNFSSVFVRGSTQLAPPNPPNMSDSPNSGLIMSGIKSTYLLGRCSHQLFIYQMVWTGCKKFLLFLFVSTPNLPNPILRAYRLMQFPVYLYCVSKVHIYWDVAHTNFSSIRGCGVVGKNSFCFCSCRPPTCPTQPSEHARFADRLPNHVTIKKYISIGTLLTPTLHLSDGLDELQNFSFVFVRVGHQLALPNPPNMSDRPTTGLIMLVSKSTYLLGRCSYQLFIYQMVWTGCKNFLLFLFVSATDLTNPIPRAYRLMQFPAYLYCVSKVHIYWDVAHTNLSSIRGSGAVASFSFCFCSWRHPTRLTQPIVWVRFANRLPNQVRIKKYTSIGTLLTPTYHLSDGLDELQKFSSVFVRVGHPTDPAQPIEPLE
jgi:hypothetical protein